MAAAIISPKKKKVKIEVNKIMKCEINNRKVDFFNKFHNENYNSKREDLEEEDQGEDERNVKS